MCSVITVDGVKVQHHFCATLLHKFHKLCDWVDFLQQNASQLSVRSQTIRIEADSAELLKWANMVCVCGTRLTYIIRHLLIVLWYSILYICCVATFPSTN